MSDIRIPITSLNRSKSVDVEQMDNPIDIGLDPGTIVRVHKDLMGRDESNQHPITAISNLASTLDDLSQTDQQLRNDLNQEITDRQNADNQLQHNIEDESLARVQADNQLQVNIDNEARDRRQADNELQQNINNEIDARESADRILQQNLNNEIRDRQNADDQLQRNIDNEVNARQQADNNLRQDITNETGAREQADVNLQNSITTIQNVIPTEATPSNQLADKAYVVNNIQTFGASYRGSWATWANVPTNPNLYPEDALGSRTPDKNDYMIVIADETQDGGTWKYVYTGVWSTNGKSGWHTEYEIEKTPFTPEQQAAIDSGITSTLVGQITTNQGDISDINTILSGYGNIVTHNVAEFATAAQGTLADTALQPNDNISELNNDAGYTDNVGTVTSVNNIEPVDGNVTIEIPDTATWGNITGTLSNQTDLQTALNGKQPTISDLDAIRTGAGKGETALQPNDNITQLTNNAGFIKGITSTDVTTALGYTPYDSTNPAGYTSNVGTVTSVNNVQPVNGDVSLIIPTVNNATLTITQGGATKGTFTANASSNVMINLDGNDGGGASALLCESVEGCLPLSDGSIQILDGTLLASNNNTAAFINKVASIASNPDNAEFFCTELEWQQEVEDKGYCDKFVYDSANNTVRVPKKAVRFSQPIMTSNGTMGGSIFAVSSNVPQYPNSDCGVYKAFDQNSSTYFHSTSGNKTGYIDMYNPEAIRVYEIELKNQAVNNRASSAGKIYGSDNGSNWTQLTAYTNSTQEASAIWYIDLSNNTHYYNYYRLESTAGGSDLFWTIEQINLKAELDIPDYRTYIRIRAVSDGALATTTEFGLVKPDNTSITVSDGVISGFSGNYNDLSNKPTMPSITFYWGE